MGLLKSIIKKTLNVYEAQIHVVGVSFKNEDGKSRQRILRAMKFKDAPFTGKIEITLNKYDFEGKAAIGVYANGQQIGNVPKDAAPDILAHWKKEYQCVDYKIIGDYETSLGIIIHAIFR